MKGYTQGRVVTSYTSGDVIAAGSSCLSHRLSTLSDLVSGVKLKRFIK